MTIEYRDRGRKKDNTDVVMTACPFCEAPIGENSGFRNHVDDCPEVPGDG